MSRLLFSGESLTATRGKIIGALQTNLPTERGCTQCHHTINGMKAVFAILVYFGVKSSFFFTVKVHKGHKENTKEKNHRLTGYGTAVSVLEFPSPKNSEIGYTLHL